MSSDLRHDWAPVVPPFFWRCGREVSWPDDSDPPEPLHDASGRRRESCAERDVREVLES